MIQDTFKRELCWDFAGFSLSLTFVLVKPFADLVVATMCLMRINSLPARIFSGEYDVYGI